MKFLILIDQGKSISMRVVHEININNIEKTGTAR